MAFRGWAALIISGMLATGCASMTVSSHVETGLDTSQYRSYDWGESDALPAGDPRIEKNPVYQDFILGAVERQMALKGFQHATDKGRADLLIHYHAAVNRRINVSQADRAYKSCFGEDCSARIVEYEQGTLVLDIVDAKTNRVIWRGWAQDTVDGVLDDEQQMVQKITEAVRRILARFPNPA